MRLRPSIRIALAFVCSALVDAAPVRGEDPATDAPARNFGSGYYGAPGISLLSNEGKGWDLSDQALGAESKYDFGGWTQFGYTDDSDGVFNTHPHHFDAQQLWLYFQKTADGSEGLDWGVRVDAVYGTDAQNTQSFGNNRGNFDYADSFDFGVYGWALPQAYAELAYKDVSVKAGHFFTLLGYEVVPAPGNFFYSHAFTMNFSEAFTHTGVLATYGGIEDVTLYGGYTLGWDTGFDQVGDGNSFLGGASYSPIDKATLTYITTFGDLGWVGSGYTHSIVLDTKPVDRLSYVIQSDLVNTNTDILGSGHTDYDTIGINQYLIYRVLDEVGIGTRIEWWKANGVSAYALTGGLNLKPLPNLTVRPEGRYQWGPDGAHPAGLPVDHQPVFGVDMILTF